MSNIRLATAGKTLISAAASSMFHNLRTKYTGNLRFVSSFLLETLPNHVTFLKKKGTFSLPDFGMKSAKIRSKRHTQ